MYYVDTSTPNVFNQPVNAYSFLTPVQESKDCFHRAKIEGADANRILQHAIGFPSSTNFKSIVKGNQLRNCPITVSSIDRADTICGPQAATLKGRSIRKRPGHV